MAKTTKYGDCRYCGDRVLWRDLPTNRPPRWITRGFCDRHCEKDHAEYARLIAAAPALLDAAKALIDELDGHIAAGVEPYTALRAAVDAASGS
tara:strand:- start:207 stop:485 length:279 start_codon:yes stop_codon:yes gene_type:complete